MAEPCLCPPAHLYFSWVAVSLGCARCPVSIGGCQLGEFDPSVKAPNNCQQTAGHGPPSIQHICVMIWCYNCSTNYPTTQRNCIVPPLLKLSQSHTLSMCRPTPSDFLLKDCGQRLLPTIKSQSQTTTQHGTLVDPLAVESCLTLSE